MNNLPSDGRCVSSPLLCAGSGATGDSLSRSWGCLCCCCCPSQTSSPRKPAVSPGGSHGSRGCVAASDRPAPRSSLTYCGLVHSAADAGDRAPVRLAAAAAALAVAAVEPGESYIALLSRWRSS